MKLSPNSVKLLSNDQRIPLLGLGVSRIEPLEKTEQVILWALGAGYRHIDTAKLYKNESFVGGAIQKSGVPRKDMWITTKLWPTDFHHPRKALEASLRRLNIGYVDLYLIHWPTPIEVPGFERKLWRSMEQLVDSGLCKTIGVSNYQIGRLQKVLSIANVPPAVNQVRCSPFTYPAKLHAYCREHGIALEGYAPLTQGASLDDNTVKSIAEKHRKSVAQILLRWALQKDIIVIPKTQSQKRLHENLDLYDFVLADEDMVLLDSLNTSRQ